MELVDPRLFEYSLSKIENGSIFENFANQFLSQVLGYKFLPAGGIKDRGIDGLEYIFYREGYEAHIYQMSIEKDYLGKLKGSLKKLKDNKIKFDSFYFVTNQEFKNKDIIIDKLYIEYKKPIHIYDIKWLSLQINHSQGTINVYDLFINTYLHEYNQPGKAHVVSDFLTDPRLFVFLRQQWDTNRGNLDLHAILADTLILYCLEGTDPDEKKFKTEVELKDDIAKLISFDFKILRPIIDERLHFLSTKPRQIKYHSALKAYCLPYETRLQIREKNLQDSSLYDQFKSKTEDDLKVCLNELNINVKNGFSLIEKTINKIFYQQGLEFADFVTNGENKEAIEKDLFEIIGNVVDESFVIPNQKELVKSAIAFTIRKMVYKGTTEQNQFLMKLSHTYMMMFMLQCDPMLCTYFQTMASKLNVYVCTSIIIPALSEYYLPEVNKRHWNLLKGARYAGVTLIINEPILSELASHFQSIVNKYFDQYEKSEDIYLSDEEQIRYINEIMIRAYFHAKFQGKVKSFKEFIDNFINPNLKNTQTEIFEWLKGEFNIQFRSDTSLGINLDEKELDLLYESLKKQKTANAKARTDAKVILTIHKIREKNNETNSSGIFGYKTWWLSKDIVTQKVVNNVFGDKYKISCYMRPDFLYDYISLAPTRSQIDSAYTQLFPTMLGVNISYHLKPEVVKVIHDLIVEHKDKNHSRLASILRNLTEKLKTEPHNSNKVFIKNYFESKINK
jgi:hypothetical protein